VLDLENKNQLSEGNFWSSESDAHLALMGAYSGLQSTYVFNSDPWGGGAMRLEYISDNGYTSWHWMPLASLERSELTSTSWGNPETFSALYDIINRSNQIISKIPEIDMDQAKADRMTGEAQTLRSTAYMILAMTYADVPLIKEPVSVAESNIGASSKSEIMDFVISDLKDAAGKLPVEVSTSEWGRLPRGAALGMAARAELFAGKFADAAATAKQVMDEGVYSLFPDYGKLFTVENEMNEEVIFPVTFERGLGGEGSNFAGFWGNLGLGYQSVAPNLGYTFYCTDGQSRDVSPLYNPDHPSENRDPRFKATIVANGDVFKGDTVSTNEFSLRKYLEENDLNHFDSPQDWYVLRYAHILLIRAEALAQMGQNSNEVISLIDQIRDRVGMPHVEDVEGSGLSQQELLDVVKHERRVETAFEGLRYFDLKRWGELGEAYQKFNENDYPLGWGGMRERVWQDRYMKWPLPQGEINTNDNLEQHPGY